MAGPVIKERPGSDTRGPRVGTRYEDDLYTWVQEQVAALRAGRLDDVDVRNVAEELSDEGRSEYDKLESALTLLLMHMLKWDHQPGRSRSWDNTIAEQRRRYHAVLEDNPGLRSRREQALARAYAHARGAASTDTDLPRSHFPVECPYPWEDILERPFDFDSVQK